MSDYMPNATRYVPTRRYYEDPAPREQDPITDSVNFLLDLLIPLFFVSGIVLGIAAFASVAGAAVPAFLLLLAGAFTLMFRMNVL
jgi:hypothetical protein